MERSVEGQVAAPLERRKTSLQQQGTPLDDLASLARYCAQSESVSVTSSPTPQSSSNVSRRLGAGVRRIFDKCLPEESRPFTKDTVMQEPLAIHQLRCRETHRKRSRCFTFWHHCNPPLPDVRIASGTTTYASRSKPSDGNEVARRRNAASRNARAVTSIPIKDRVSGFCGCGCLCSTSGSEQLSM